MEGLLYTGVLSASRFSRLSCVCVTIRGAMNGHYDACNALLIGGADKSIKTRFKYLPYDAAKSEGHEKLAKLLRVK